MAVKNEKTKSEVGIIGQTYEERKSGKLGVLEGRKEKFKTLLMRDVNGQSFDINYSTFRSNWRKYQGEAVVQTSAQKAEEAQTVKEELKEAKKEMAKSTETTIKFDRKERMDAIKALRVVLADSIKDAKYPLEIVNLSKGGTVVKLVGKKRTMFEIWLPLRYPDIYSFRLRDDLNKFVETDEPSEFLEKDVNCIRYRPKRENFDVMLKALLTAIEKFVDETGFLDTTKNDKNEEKEN